MKRVIFTNLIILLFTLSVYSQKVYPAYQTELIFSLAAMNSTAVPSSQVVRFSGFWNQEMQVHVNAGKHIGYYFGWGVKNLGMINRFGDQDVNLKQRSYALGLPLALKFGPIQKHGFVAVGADFNFLIDYKEKFLYGDTKTKRSEWFSNKVNAFQPAVFLQFKYLKGQVLTFKYFLNDYLRFRSGALVLPDGTAVTDYGRSSHLFYVSWGSNLEFKDSEAKQKQKELKIREARLD